MDACPMCGSPNPRVIYDDGNEVTFTCNCGERWTEEKKP